MKEFREFLLKQNALALAIGVIIGSAVGKIVSSLVADILMPVISIGLPGGSWREAQIVLSRSVDGSGAPVVNAMKIGPFLGSVIDFVIVAFVLFWLGRILIKPAPVPATKTCPECLEALPVEAKRCRACTAPVA